LTLIRRPTFIDDIDAALCRRRAGEFVLAHALPDYFGGYAMNLRTSVLMPALAALLLAPAVLHGQAINPPTAVQTSPAMTEQERRNLAFVLDWWREVIQGGHLELSSKYQHDDYIQHNPLLTQSAMLLQCFQCRHWCSL
jgi:hypothetical protein